MKVKNHTEHLKGQVANAETLNSRLTLNIFYMSFSKDQEKMLGNNGWKRSNDDSNKFINGSGHSVTSRGNTTIFDRDRHTTNSGISNSLFDKKSK